MQRLKSDWILIDEKWVHVVKKKKKYKILDKIILPQGKQIGLG